MRKLLLLIGLFLSLGLWAQEASDHPRVQRTPQDEALKQTTRLVRELGIKDSARIDTLYKIHLKYALTRQKGLTRAQNLERMQAIYDELKQLLTPEEFDRFMNHPAEQPRHPRGALSAPNRPAPPTERQ